MYHLCVAVRRDVLPDDSLAQAHAEPQDSILLAESRELLLNQYVQDLIKLPPKVRLWYQPENFPPK